MPNVLVDIILIIVLASLAIFFVLKKEKKDRIYKVYKKGTYVNFYHFLVKNECWPCSAEVKQDCTVVFQKNKNFKIVFSVKNLLGAQNGELFTVEDPSVLGVYKELDGAKEKLKLSDIEASESLDFIRIFRLDNMTKLSKKDIEKILH